MTAASRVPTPDIDQSILDEAADWLVLLQSGEATDTDQTGLARWRERSPAHEAAWRRAEGVLATFQQVPPRLGRETLSRLPRARRRALLALLAIAVPGAWLAWRLTPWQQGTVDLSTAIGERKTTTLVDGTRLVLNTATTVDVAFTATERRLTLVAGEVLITTAQDSPPLAPPFIVHTPQGSLRPLGTRFNVRRLDDTTRVTVLEGAVEVRPAASVEVAVVRAGEQMAFTATALQDARPADASASLWERGMLLARDMRLEALVAELGRYHRGFLGCDPEVADLIVSGAFPVADLQTSLALLEKSLPVRISRATSYWITVRPR